MKRKRTISTLDNSSSRPSDYEMDHGCGSFFPNLDSEKKSTSELRSKRRHNITRLFLESQQKGCLSFLKHQLSPTRTEPSNYGNTVVKRKVLKPSTEENDKLFKGYINNFVSTTDLMTTVSLHQLSCMTKHKFLDSLIKTSDE